MIISPFLLSCDQSFGRIIIIIIIIITIIIIIIIIIIKVFISSQDKKYISHVTIFE